MSCYVKLYCATVILCYITLYPVPNSVLNVYTCNDSIARYQAFFTQSSSEVPNHLQEQAIRYSGEPNPLCGRRLLLRGEVPSTDPTAMAPSSETPSASSHTQSSIPSISNLFMDGCQQPPSHAPVPPSTRSPSALTQKLRSN
jgi:hypothetical protein